MSKHPPKKSIISHFSALSAGLTESTESEGHSSTTAHMQPVARVGAGVIGATQRTLTEIREERDRLQAQLDAGGGLEIDPALIDPSPFPDRLPDDNDLEFTALKKLISEEGQQVPIGVRRHPGNPDRYQVVYGHRRLRAAKELGIAVRAVVASLSDTELVIAQGIENSARKDLSWIEKALFAWRMDQAGIKARDIRAALAIDDPELARFRAVCRSVSIETILAIGRAPKAGRPRWVALANAVATDPDSMSRVRATLAAAKESSSDCRFRAALEATKKAPMGAVNNIELTSPTGSVIGRAVFAGDKVRLTLRKSQAEAFAVFLKGELPSLIDRFFERERGGNSNA